MFLAAAAAAPDPHRPALHFTPPEGWQNDPSKPIEDTRVAAAHRYHLFFQWTPNSTLASWQGGWGPFWGHAVAESIAGPFEMLCVPGAQRPDCAVNIGRQGTGGSVRLNATHYALTWPGGAAVTDDPRLHEWTVFESPLPPAPGFPFFSGNDNAVWTLPGAAGVEMAVSGCTGTVGDRHADPALLRYRATAVGAGFSYVAPIWAGRGLRQGRAECGDYFPLAGRHVAMYSHSGSQVVWMVGDELRNGTFVPATAGVADYGEFYASASFGLDGGSRRVLWAWVPEARPYPYDGSAWAGVQALPREVAVDAAGRLAFAPARELQRWRRRAWRWPSVRVGAAAVPLPALTAVGAQLELLVELQPPLGSGPGVVVRAGGAERTFVGLRDAAVVVDRSASCAACPASKSTLSIVGEPVGQGPVRLRVFVDHSVVTVFTASGRALTARVYPDAGSLGVWLVGGGVFNVTAWSLSGTALEASGV